MKSLFCIYWNNHVFLFFFYSCKVLNWLICICWMNSHLVMTHDLFYVAIGFGLLKFCWHFLHLYSWKILAYNFLFLVVSFVLVSASWWFHRSPWEYSVFNILEKFKKDGYKFFFVCLLEFTCEAIWSWTFAGRECFYYIFSFISVLIIYFFCSEELKKQNHICSNVSTSYSFGQMYVFRNLSISSRLSHLLAKNCS